MNTQLQYYMNCRMVLKLNVNNSVSADFPFHSDKRITMLSGNSCLVLDQPLAQSLVERAVAE